MKDNDNRRKKRYESMLANIDSPSEETSKAIVRSNVGMIPLADARLQACAMYLESNGSYTNTFIADKLGVPLKDVHNWHRNDNWDELVKAKLAVVQVELAKLSASFTAEKLAEIHTADLRRIFSLNEHIETLLKQNLYVDENGETRTKLNAFSLKALAEALQWNVRTARTVMGKDQSNETNGAIASAQDLMSAISNSWAQIAAKRAAQMRPPGELIDTEWKDKDADSH